jgi:hypothetical protein
MRITSILRNGMLALALGAAVTSIAPAFAGTADQSSRSQLYQSGSTGIYDGPAWEASKNADNG